MRRSFALAPLAILASACWGAPVAGTGGAPATSTSPSSSSSSGAGGAPTSSSSSSSSSGAGGSGPAPFALLSLNLHCLKVEGTAYATNADRFAAVAALAAARGVAVMTVQEACKTPAEDALEMLRQALSAATGSTWTSAWAEAHLAWAGTPDEADEGVGLLARGPLADPVTLDHAVQGALRRVALSAALPPDLGGARVTTVHFDVFDASFRAAQAREAAAAALADADPTFAAVVAGDFNDVEGSPAVSTFPALGYLDATAGLDPAGIDHVMIHRAAPLRPVSTEQVFLGADAVSDHPGILVQLTAAPGDPVTPTRVIAHADPGAGHFLSLRGDTAPLSWSAGYPMRARAGGWMFVSTEITSPFAFKTLVDDSAFQTGADASGLPGQDNEVTPSF